MHRTFDRTTACATARQLSLIGLAAAIAGCDLSGETASPPAPLPAAQSPAPSGGPVADEPQSNTPDVRRSADGRPSSSTSASPSSAVAASQFTPPFPHRQDMFQPPDRPRADARRTGDGEAVELKGFVRVDQPRVVLAIDGVIAPLPEGGEKYGVEVISIQPPSVVLQRGRARWTATLE